MTCYYVHRYTSNIFINREINNIHVRACPPLAIAGATWHMRSAASGRGLQANPSCACLDYAPLQHLGRWIVVLHPPLRAGQILEDSCPSARLKGLSPHMLCMLWDANGVLSARHIL